MPEAVRSQEPLTKEIERKFLISTLPPEINLDDCESTRISQGYLAVDGRAAVRVRQKGDEFFITYKGAPMAHAEERVELETALTEEQFATLWPGTLGRRVEKTRYLIPYDDLVIEMDVFEGDNAGYVLAEVEFSSLEGAQAFVAPEWIVEDVTADKRFGNSWIAEHGFPRD